MISEQICEEAQRHEIETVAELEEKISDLRKLLQDKEYAIQELEKIKAVPEQEGVVIKYREVILVALGGYNYKLIGIDSNRTDPKAY